MGKGFTFDDREKDRNSVNSIAEMNALLARDERNRSLIFPYIGGEELNESPEQKPHRYVINFGEMTEDEARRWSDLFRIVEQKVKPERNENNRDVYRKNWWQFGEKQLSLYRLMQQRKRVLANSLVSTHLSFAWCPPNWVLAHTLNVVPIDGDEVFAVLQSRVHEVWARFFGSSMKDDLRYTPTDCFETFPFAVGWECNARLGAIGKEYYEFRAKLMVDNNEGLTKTYNRFHDPDERDDRIKKLRELHNAMDRAVLDAYGWTEIRPTCEFIAEYDDADEEAASGGRKKKRPMRYRWPDEVRDEVLAKLIELNAERAKEEERARQEAKVGQQLMKGIS